MSDELTDNDDDDIPVGGGNRGLLVRVYKRQAKKDRRSRETEHDRDTSRNRGRDRQGGYDAKGGRDAEFSAEERIRADQEADARVRARAQAAVADLGQRLAAVKDELATLEGKLTERLTRAADPLKARLKQATTDLASLVAEEADPPDVLQRAAAIAATVARLADHAAKIDAKIPDAALTAALAWAAQAATYGRFPAVRQEVTNIHAALAGGEAINTGALTAAIAAIEQSHTAETDALAARLILRNAWAAARLLVDLILARVAAAADRAGNGQAVVLAAPIDGILAADMPVQVSDPAQRQALLLTIQNLHAWAQAAGPAIAGFPYFDAVLQDGRQAYRVMAQRDQPPPRIASNIVVTGMLETACLAVPFNAAIFQDACNEAILFPGTWQGAVRRDNTQQAAQAAMQQAVAGTAALSAYLQQAAPGWGLAPGAANTLAAQFYKAYPNAEAVLRASGVQQNTWNRLTVFIPELFADLPAAFAAIGSAGNTEATVRRLVVQRLERRGHTAAFGAAVLASGDAVLQGARGYPSTNINTGVTTQGASVNLAWVGWMPIRFASEGYWGAVHFHFPGNNVAAVPTMAHIKEYEIQGVGGQGALNIITGSALAGTCLVPVQAAGFHL